MSVGLKTLLTWDVGVIGSSHEFKLDDFMVQLSIHVVHRTQILHLENKKLKNHFLKLNPRPTMAAPLAAPSRARFLHGGGSDWKVAPRSSCEALSASSPAPATANWSHTSPSFITACWIQRHFIRSQRSRKKWVFEKWRQHWDVGPELCYCSARVFAGSSVPQVPSI